MTITYCRRCALPSTFPNSAFEEDVCGFCRNVEAGRPGTGRPDRGKIRKDMAELFDSVRGSSYFECIVCFSGGKDSTCGRVLEV